MIAVLINHLWQSTLFALVAALLALALRNDAAHTRYWVWQVASIKFLFPFSILVTIGSHLGWHSAPTISPQPIVDAVELIAQPYPVTSAVQFASAPTPTGVSPITILFAIWICGFAAVLLLWFANWRKISAVLRSATPLALSAPIPVRSSASRLEPGVVGILRPVLLLPEGIGAHLAQEELQTIVTHEMCHLRRADNLTAVIHMLVQALFWFHPLVWWLGARLVEERERACDEAVVKSGSNPQIYAEAILKVCKLYVQSPLICAAGVSGADLKTRIEAIMTNRNIVSLNLAKKLLLGVVSLSAIVGPLVVGSARSSYAEPPPNVTSSPASTDADTVAARRAEQERPRTAIKIDPKLLDKFVGYYLMPGARSFTITRKDDQLYAQLIGQPSLPIYPESNEKFFYTVVAAQLSFATDTQGNVTGLVLHQNGQETPAKRSDQATVQSASAAFSEKMKERIKENEPVNGSDVVLRHQIEGIIQGQPDYSQMSDELAAAARPQMPSMQSQFAKLGPMQSITFRGAGGQGADVYDVKFADGIVTARINVIPNGKIVFFLLTPGP